MVHHFDLFFVSFLLRQAAQRLSKFNSFIQMFQIIKAHDQTVKEEQKKTSTKLKDDQIRVLKQTLSIQALIMFKIWYFHEKPK